MRPNATALDTRVRRKHFELVLSPVVAGEITDAPAAVRRLFDEIIQLAEVTAVSAAAIRLQEGYIGAGIVWSKHSTDALHVLQATVAAKAPGAAGARTGAAGATSGKPRAKRRLPARLWGVHGRARLHGEVSPGAPGAEEPHA